MMITMQLASLKILGLRPLRIEYDLQIYQISLVSTTNRSLPACNECSPNLFPYWLRPNSRPPPIGRAAVAA